MKVINIGYYNRVKYFDLPEANALLPIIMRITRLSAKQISLHDEILAHSDLQPQFLAKINADKQLIIEKWCSRIEQLGGLSLHESSHNKGATTGRVFGTVFFDTGHGYLYWNFPQHQLRYFVPYEDEISNRLTIEAVAYQYPQWLSPHENPTNKSFSATTNDEIIANGNTSMVSSK